MAVYDDEKKKTDTLPSDDDLSHITGIGRADAKAMDAKAVDDHEKAKKEKDDKKKGTLGGAAETAQNAANFAFNPETAVAKKGIKQAVQAVTGGGEKTRRNWLVGGGVALATISIAGFVLMANFIFTHELIHIQQAINQLENKLADDVEGRADKRVLFKIFTKARNVKNAKAEAEADAKDPLTNTVDTVASEPHQLDPFLEDQGLDPQYDSKGLAEVENGQHKAVTPNDEDMAGLVDEVKVQGIITTNDPVAVVAAGVDYDPLPESDPRSKSDDPKVVQEALRDAISKGATGEAIAAADGKVTQQDAQQTGDTNTDAANQGKVAQEAGANKPLEAGINAANEAYANGATAGEAITAGVNAFKEKVGASLTDKFFITGMITMLCNFEKAIQVASDARVPQLMALDMRSGGVLESLADHEKNSGGGPANVPALNTTQVKAMMLVVQNDPQLVTATKTDPDPVANMPFTRSAEWATATHVPVTNTTNPAAPHYTPAVDASSLPTRNAGQIIVDTIASFMKATGLNFGCQVLTSTFGIVIQIAAGIGQIISSIGSLGAADVAIFAGNVAIQQFLFSYVLPQAIAYFTNLGVGLNSPVPFINNVGVGINLTAGTTARFQGALPKTRAETKVLMARINQEQFNEEQQKPFTYRAFAFDNPYSLTYKLMNKMPAPFTSGNIFTSVSSYFVSLPSSVGHVFSNISSAHVFAAASFQLNPNTVNITQYHVITNFDPQANEYYLRDPKHDPNANVTVDGQTATRITMLGDPYTYQMSPTGDPNNNDLMHCFVDSPLIMTDKAGGNPNQKFCGALGRYDYVDDGPQKLGYPNDNTVTDMYCEYFHNPANCHNIIRPQVHNDVMHYSQYLGDKAAASAVKDMVTND